MASIGLSVWVVLALLVGCGEDDSQNREALSSGEAEGAVKAYYTALDDFDYRKAWEYVGRLQKSTLDMGFGGWSRSWKRNYRMKVRPGTVTSVNPTTATVAGTLNRLDYDACNNKVWQTYSGTWTVRLDDGRPLLDSESLSKIAGPEPVQAIADCETILPPPPTEPRPLSAGGGDVDCDDVGHPIEINGSDPNGLDADGDGIGCESE